MPPRHSRARDADAAAAVPADDAEERARPAARQRLDDGGGINADDAGGDALALELVPGGDNGGDVPAPAAQALADHSRLFQDGGRRAQAHARAVARAAHFAVFDEGEEGGGGGGAGGARNATAAATAAAAHTGGERAAARELGMWATSQALIQGRDAAAAARREAAKGKAAAAEAPALIRWTPRERSGAGGSRSAADDAAAAPATPVLVSGGPSRVPSLLRMTAELVAENLDVVESLEGVPDGARAAVAAAAARRRTLDAAGASLLAAGSPGEVFVPDASRLDAAAMLSLLEDALHPGVERLELEFCGRGLGDSTAVSAAERARGGGAGGATAASPPPAPLPLLSHLRLGGAYRLSDRGLSALLSLSPALRALSLPQAPKITGAAVAALPGLVPGLRVLDLAHCRGVGSEALLSALLGLGQGGGGGGGHGGGGGGGGKKRESDAAALFLEEIEEIALDGLTAVDDEFLLKIAKALSSSSSSSLTTTTKNKLPLSRLSRVSLRQCSGVSDAGVVALLEAASSAAAAAAAAAAASAAPTSASASTGSSSSSPRYLGLNSLALDGCPITDATLEALARCPQPLSKLSLAGCKSLSDGALAAAVERLGVAGGGVAGGGGGGGGERAAPKAAAAAADDDESEVPFGLRCLSVSGVSRAGEQLIAALLRSCPRSLEEFDVSWCRGVPARALGALADGCPRLRTLTSYGCTHVGEEVVKGHANPRTVFVGASSVREPPAKDAAAALVLD